MKFTQCKGSYFLDGLSDTVIWSCNKLSVPAGPKLKLLLVSIGFAVYIFLYSNQCSNHLQLCIHKHNFDLSCCC